MSSLQVRSNRSRHHHTGGDIRNISQCSVIPLFPLSQRDWQQTEVEDERKWKRNRLWKCFATDHERLCVEEELGDDGGQPALTVHVMNHAQRQRLDWSQYLQECATAEQCTLPLQIHNPRTNLSQKATGFTECHAST